MEFRVKEFLVMVLRKLSENYYYENYECTLLGKIYMFGYIIVYNSI